MRHHRTYPTTNNEATIRVTLIENKKIKLDNKLRICSIALDVLKMKKICAPKAYDFVMSVCEDYKNFISIIAI